MDQILTFVTDSPKPREFNDDDFSDRLSSKYTVTVLILFGVYCGLNELTRDPITCWAPAHFQDSHASFAQNYCWIKNTYYLPWNASIPKEWGTEEGRQMITYYQWISFILFGQAVLFYLPALVWNGLNSKAGVDADNILSSAKTFSKTDMAEIRQTTLHMLTQQIDRFLTTQNVNRTSDCDFKSICSNICCRLCGKRIGNYLLLLYLFSKFCYIVNVVGQLFLLNVVLSTKYSTFGFDMVQKMAKSTEWTDESYVAFPRVTLCDFEIRGQDMSNVHRYTIQCVLPLNLYNEKIYIFLWYWMVFVACASCSSFFLWSLRAIFRCDRLRFVKNHLNLEMKSYTDEQLKDFTFDYLRQDGSLLLRLIAHNLDCITTTEITCSLWDRFKSQTEVDQHLLTNNEHNKSVED